MTVSMVQPSDPVDDLEVRATIGSEPVRVEIADLSTGVRVRAGGLDEAHVRILSEIAATPPVVVHRASMTIIDGVHRVEAARVRGLSQVEAVFFEGDVGAAFVLAVTLNCVHGLPLSRSDRRLAVERILVLRPSWSDRRIAQAAGVSPKTVGAARRRLVASRSSEESSQSNGTVGTVGRVGLDGRSRPVDPVPGRCRAETYLAAHPDATTRQIARGAGVSTSTGHDVRRRAQELATPLVRTAAQASAPAPRAGDPVRGREAVPGGGEAPDATDPLVETGIVHLPVGLGPGNEAELQAALLASLRGDPSLRDTEAGRVILRLLAADFKVTAELAGMLGALPGHRRTTVADLARRSAQAWLDLARCLEHE